MGRLDPEKLHVSYVDDTACTSTLIPRCYTLTHSDLTGRLWLTIGREYDSRQLSHCCTRLWRDEVLAEWQAAPDEVALNVHCHVSGGFVLGWPRLRNAIFRRELPLALEALCIGDQALFDTQPALDHAPILVHFHAEQARYAVTENWGCPADYRTLRP
jgi:hypothetical protein